MATTEEMLRWQRAAVLPEVRKTIESALTAKTADATKRLRTAYEMCDGTTLGSEIAAALGVSKQSISTGPAAGVNSVLRMRRTTGKSVIW